MKFTLLLFCYIPFFGVAQSTYFKELLFYSDVQAEKYLDSLNRAHPSDNYTIKRGVTSEGDLTLECFFGDSVQQFITCRQIYLRFERIQGVEMCTSQMIFGEAEFAYQNLIHIKDNYKYVSKNKWQKTLSLDQGFLMYKTAKFSRYANEGTHRNDADTYRIDYVLFIEEKSKHRK